MAARDGRRATTSQFEIDLEEGWLEYRQALELLEQSDGSFSLLLLAKAEAIFRTRDDLHGLWRALIGQALLHLRDGIAPLAIARALAAMRVAEATADGYAVGCVAWQLANMMLGQGEYRRAADFLDQAQLALDSVGLTPPGGMLAAAARLCGEIVRWQQMCERQQVGPREAEAAIVEIQQDLLARLNQATTSVRITPVVVLDADRESTFLTPEVPPMPSLPQSAVLPTGPGNWLTRLWRRLIQSADVSAAEGLTRAPSVPASDALDRAAAPDVGVGTAEVSAAATSANLQAAATAEPDALADPASTSQTPEPAVVQRDVEPPPIAAEPPASPVPEPTPVAPVAEPAPAPEPPVAASHSAELHSADTNDGAEAAADPTLIVHLLGPFQVILNGHAVESWPSGRGRAVFKYLLAHRERPMQRDVLMEAFWPEASPESARNSLNVALHGLRQALRAASDVPVVIFQNGAYRLSPDLRVSIDVEEFKRSVQAGRRYEDGSDLASAIAEYQQAAALYQGDFMADDLYDNWPALLRERLRVAYLDTLDRLSHIYFGQGQFATCITLCQLILAQDNCREDAHCHLIRCYSRQGQYHLALRQYQACVEALRDGLDVDPAPTTIQLYERVRRHEQV
ncbi:MAG: BTAD domain-containing putative transcriptional regulator [Roseiflexaceae bacterium]